jgi:primary-amine oxidase
VSTLVLDSIHTRPSLQLYLSQKLDKMVLERVKQMAAQLTGQLPPPHPLDPLSSSEIKEAVAIVRKEHSDVFFNAVTLWEPRKKQMMAWLATPDTVERPHRVADIVAIGRGSKVFDGTVDLEEKKILSWDLTEGVQPLVSTF